MANFDLVNAKELSKLIAATSITEKNSIAWWASI
jgi:hypothetical protein